MDHVRSNVADDLSLVELARVAHFSPHHFHRIFSAVTGETVAQFTRRARLERAVFLMRAAPHRTLTSISAEVGFATPSEFSRVFRARYGRSPSEWDRRSTLDGPPRIDPLLELRRRGGVPEFVARLVDRPAVRVAYVRVADPWREGNLGRGYDHLRRWFDARALPWRDRALIGASWESPQATDHDRLVYDLGIAVDPSVEPDDDVGVHRFAASRAVEVHCRSLPATALAWEFLYSEWFPASNYEPGDLPALKRFRTTPTTLDAEAWDVDCSIAVRPLRR